MIDSAVPGRDARHDPGELEHSGRRRRSLRWRVSALVALAVCVALVVISAASGIAMRQWMVSQIDEDLANSLERGPHDGDLPEGSPDASQDQTQSDSSAPEGLNGPGAGDGTLRLTSSGGDIESGVVQDHEIVSLDSDVEAKLLGVPATGAGHTVGLGDLGSFRVAAIDTGGRRIVIGQSLNSTNGVIATLIWVEGVLSVLIAAAVAFGALSWLSRELRPLARVASTARRIGDLDLHGASLRPLERVDPEDTEPGTEVGDVGQALNTMIDNVESALRERMRSEDRLRQFVADASHELRTPLASIQGYTQLLQRQSVDLELALTRISSESHRMSGLVEDMLLLARLDAGRELAAVLVDVVPLAVDAVSDAHAAGPDHVWSLDIGEDAVSCVIRGDEAGLRQVFANLVNNARVHTPAGTHVVVGVHACASGERAESVGGDAVVIRVSDDGPGIPEDMRVRVFDRFVRGDTSRSRSGSGAGSSGLGLAIVSSIVESLGGHVELETSDEGTTFVVVLARVTEADSGGHTSADDDVD